MKTKPGSKGLNRQSSSLSLLPFAKAGGRARSVCQSEDDVGVKLAFVECLEPGNFHVQAKSKLFERAPEIVAQKALAEMRHTSSAPAPVGPPALTADAWLGADIAEDDHPAAPIVGRSKQAGGDRAE